MLVQSKEVQISAADVNRVFQSQEYTTAAESGEYRVYQALWIKNIYLCFSIFDQDCISPVCYHVGSSRLYHLFVTM